MRGMHVGCDLFRGEADLRVDREMPGMRGRHRVRGFERSCPRSLRYDRRLRAVHGDQFNQVHGHDQRLQHDDQRVRAMPDERDLFGHEAELRDRDEYLPWLRGRERLLRFCGTDGVRSNRRVRPVHGQHGLLGHHAYLRGGDKYLPEVLRR